MNNTHFHCNQFNRSFTDKKRKNPKLDNFADPRFKYFRSLLIKKYRNSLTKI